jgi:peptidoglycan-associated lipoprotein
MRQSILTVALGALIALPGCHHPPPAAPRPAPAPVAPATPPPAPAPATPPEGAKLTDEYERLRQMSSDEIDRMGLLSDIHFDYNKADIRDADRDVLSRNAEVLKKFDFLKITVEGHCDERGSVEYNLALGDKRSRAAQEQLVALGVPADRLKMVSYGKEIPLCTQSTEECWARNRRGHFAVTSKTR